MSVAPSRSCPLQVDRAGPGCPLYMTCMICMICIHRVYANINCIIAMQTLYINFLYTYTLFMTYIVEYTRA